MASSKSLRKGQIPTSCKLCEVETKISWKCVDCDILMCNRCKERIHPNIRNAENHNVKEIKDIGKTEDVDFNNIPCEVHKSQVCVMFCMSCDQLVCPQCIAKIHNGHGLVEISEGYKSQTQKLKDSQVEMKIETDKLAKDKYRIKHIREIENAKYIEAKKKIETHIKAQKRAVEQYGENLLRELHHKWETLLNSIEKEEHKVMTMAKNKIDRNTLIEDILQSKDAEKIFEMSNQLEKSLVTENQIVQLNFTSMPSFIPGEISQSNVGSLQPVPIDITLQVIREYTTDISRVFFVSFGRDSLWISDENTIQKVQPEENHLRVISTINIKIIDMYITPSYDLLIAPFPESVLKQISSTTNKLTDTNYSVAPLILTTVCITSEGRVIVGARNPGEPFPATGRRPVVIMDNKGKHTATYEYDRHNKPLFTLPRHVTTTNTGNICVVDRLDKDVTGRVVVLEKDGDVINIYTGHPDVNTEDKPFKPTAIVTTPSDNIITADTNTDTLHVLNNNGNFIKYINTLDIGIELPYSIAFTTRGQVFIGCSTPIDSTEYGKLYEVKLLGC